jgi:Dihydroorotate dehydrogenase
LKSINEQKKLLNSKVPLVVKISPDIHEKEVSIISDLLLKFDISAVIISNSTDTTRENLININKLEKGGLSGKPLEKKSNNLISKFYEILKGKVFIIGVGGVDSGKSAYEKFLRGANLIQLYTGMVYQGPNIASKISEELINILEKEGIKNLSDIIGNQK